MQRPPQTEPGHDNCRLEPGIAATIAEDGIFEDENNGYGPAAGNPDVFEETADTWTLGFSINPPWAENLRLAVDYWDITIEDKITQYQNSEIMAQCYDSSQPWGDTNLFCNEISRHEDDGQIYQILNRQYNLEGGKAKGVDVAMDYDWDFGSNGNLLLKLDWTHMLEDSDTYEGLDGLVTTDYTNQAYYGNFDDRATLSATWRNGDWRVRWTSRYKSSAMDTLARVEDWNERFALNEERCAEGSSRCVENPETPLYLNFPSYTRHDISASYSMDTENFGRLRLYAGVKNIFDDLGPFIPYGGDTSISGAGNFDTYYGGGVGQFWYAGVEMSFELSSLIKAVAFNIDRPARQRAGLFCPGP